jgi:methionine synthase II (cobalamin-independent)
MRERAINEERIKQRKKLEIISRMKQQEQRKIEEQKKKEMNQHFLQQLKGSNSKQNIQPKGESRLAQESSNGSRAPAFP